MLRMNCGKKNRDYKKVVINVPSNIHSTFSYTVFMMLKMSFIIHFKFKHNNGFIVVIYYRIIG